MNKELLKDLIIGIIFLLAELLIFQHLSIFGTTPDLLLIYLLWLAMKKDRFQLLILAAMLGFVQDALFDFWGLNMFSKTLVCLIAYNFIERNKEGRLLLWQIFAITGLFAVLHNVCFLGLSNFVDTYSSGFQPAIFVIGSSLYTAIVGSMLFIFKGS
ncbi:MAG: rod shape-determining protein MreD [Gracilimonas sp.]|jgi:rod shape-determining protein MreD|nr:rod shape-determining protein MreD [Gracilimonas sp.]